MVSGGELRRALAAGIPASRIMFSGVGKTPREMDLALEAGIYCFNVEIEPELEVLNQRAVQAPASKAPCLLPHQSGCRCRAPMPRSRPARRKTSSAFPGSAPAPSTPMPPRLHGIQVTGIDMHIGSQITELQPFDDAFKLLRELVDTLRSRRPRDRPCRYRRRPRHSLQGRQQSAAAARCLCRNRQEPAAVALNCKIVTEPGRLIVGNAGILVTEVIYVKDGGEKTFVIVDGAMNDLIRPTLYEAYHEIRPVAFRPPMRPASRPTSSARSARPATIWRSTAKWPCPSRATCFAVSSAGAYGAVQAGTYNSRLLVPEVLVKGDRVPSSSGRAQSYEDLIGLDSLFRPGLTERRSTRSLCWRTREIAASGRFASPLPQSNVILSCVA